MESYTHSGSGSSIPCQGEYILTLVSLFTEFFEIVFEIVQLTPFHAGSRLIRVATDKCYPRGCGTDITAHC